MRITKLKWKDNSYLSDECGDYRIEYSDVLSQLKLYYKNEVLERINWCDDYYDSLIGYLKRIALDHANKLLEEKCS